MSYKIGQFRKDMENHYLIFSQLSSKTIITSSSNVVGSIKFQDIALSIEGGFSNQKCYYVQFQIPRTSLIQNFTISLGNIDEQGQISVEQYLKTFSIPPLDQNESNDINRNTIFEIIFNANINFSDLIIRLNRTIEDYQISSNEGIAGRIFSVNNFYCFEIKNIIGNLSGVSEIEKLGVQSRPGLLMCINGQEIRVGPSGIYEIKNGYKVTFIGFVIKDASTTDDYFILDYQYEGR